MWGKEKITWSTVAICCMFCTTGVAQGLSLKEMIARYLFSKTLGFMAAGEKTKITQDLDYTLSTNGLVLINWVHDNKVNQASVCQNLRYHCLLQNSRNIKINNTFVHNLGIQYFFDSTANVNIDDNTLTTRVEIRLFDRFRFTLDSRLASRLLNGFDLVVNDSGKTVRTLNSSFLTPLTWIASAGFGYSRDNFGFLNLGFTGIKLTYIRNREIFSIRGITDYHGIEAGKDHLLEYGITFQVMIDKNVLETLHWNLDLLIFKNYNAPADLMLKNLLGLKINKFLKASLQTRICYEEKLSKHLQFENILSVGLNLNL